MLSPTLGSILNLTLKSVAMKKIIIFMAVLVAAVLVSCQKEQSFEGFTPLKEGDIAFVIQNASTKSDAFSNVETGVSIPLGNASSGESFFLEETIEELNPCPTTKGAPAYTVNVGSVHKSMGVYAAGNFGDATFEVMDLYDHKGNPSDPNAPISAAPDATKGDGWRYVHNYSASPWPDNNTLVDFFLRMPASDDGIQIDQANENAVNGITYNNTDKTMTFDYVSPLEGESQTDILFSHTSLSKAQHDGYLPNGAPVLMHHALTGVKFRTGNDNTGTTKTIITKVEFTGLAASGHCVVGPSGLATWSNWGSTGLTFTQQFTNHNYQEVGDGTVTYNKDADHPENNKFGDSWYSAAAGQNLNDEDGSLTFWFIPQTLNENVKLSVTFCVKTPDTSGENGGGLITHTIDFGTVLKDVEWKAGQLRTYTLSPKEVDVAIIDEMTSGWKKENLHVTNTGNVHEYVRMTFLGNWYDKDGNIVVGYKYSGPADPNLPEGADPDEMVLPWYAGGYKGLDQSNPNVYVDPYGYFDETFLLGSLPDGSDWVRASGGYYYTKAIGPGIKLNAQTQALFKSYTLTSIPTIYVPSSEHEYRVPAEGVHLVMEVAIQAIYAPMTKDDEGHFIEASTWQREWYNATGNEKLNPGN